MIVALVTCPVGVNGMLSVLEVKPSTSSHCYQPSTQIGELGGGAVKMGWGDSEVRG